VKFVIVAFKLATLTTHTHEVPPPHYIRGSARQSVVTSHWCQHVTKGSLNINLSTNDVDTRLGIQQQMTPQTRQARQLNIVLERVLNSEMTEQREPLQVHFQNSASLLFGCMSREIPTCIIQSQHS